MARYNLYTDQELGSLLTAGDQRAYTEIYDRYHAALYIHVSNRLRDREEARDLVHDLFSDLWAKRQGLAIHTSLKAYLFAAARYRVFEWISRTQVRSQYMDSAAAFISAGECLTDHRIRERQLMELIDLEIAALPAKMREIFELSRNGGLSHRQIAEKLGLAETTVKKQVNNSLKVLRAKLGAAAFTAFIL